jgi:threonine 3-dehydrogenase
LDSKLKAVAKTKPAQGLEIINADEPCILPGHVKIKLETASICGTDLHIYDWDSWASSRMKPPVITGHEFAGTIVEVGEGVSQDRMGEFVSSESRISCGHCPQCLKNQAHLCNNFVIIGVDRNGGFAPYTVIPAKNARTTSSVIPKEIACMQDAIGNAVHAVMYNQVKDQTVLITGLGPLGLFAAAICKTMGAKKIYATEVSDYRIALGKKMGADEIINPLTSNATETLQSLEPQGVDFTLEMSGHSSSLNLASKHTRRGGQICLLGLFPGLLDQVDLNTIVLHGKVIQGVTGRKQWETWDQMQDLLVNKHLDLSPIVTHQMHYLEIEKAISVLKAGQAGKVVLHFN